jgi:hypothetical protein
LDHHFACNKEKVSQTSGAAVLGIFWVIGWELSLKLPISYRPAKQFSGEFVIVHDATAVGVARRH